MWRRLTRISLALVLMLSSEVWAIGLGEINLDSALNEPLYAEIELLSATPEELADLKINLASAETFERYGIDRPFYLQDIEFNVLRDGSGGAVVRVRSRTPITEPFLTFLVEATWPSGRLLREYTVLLDPPTYAPPAVQQAPAVEAPRRAEPTDSARIERQQPVEREQPVEQQRATPAPAQPRATPPPVQPREQEPNRFASESSYSSESGGDYYVQRGDTLWGIASRMRPDSRLTMNQTMLAIFEANPEAFDGNINRLSAGASLRVPSADEVFQISRGDAFSEVKRQNQDWAGGTGFAAQDTDYSDTTSDTAYADTTADADYTAAPESSETRPSLTLVPPDEEPAGIEYDDELSTSEPLTRDQEIENRIAELEAADVPDQQSLIEIRDNELATLRQELATIRGETLETPVDDDLFADDDEAADEIVADDAAGAVDDEAAEADAETSPPTSVIRTPRVDEPGIMDRVMAILSSFWTKIIAALVLVAGVLLWFVRRGRDEEDESAAWESLDSDEVAASTMSATEALHAPTRDDESIVVVEQDSGIRPMDEDAVDAVVPELDATVGDEGAFGSLEDTFSSETAVNLDQTDPLSEADFHMAYGLYDQAADLINNALEADPTDKALLSKLCEIYFVWGNEDSFVDAATRLNTAIGGEDSAEWGKIVIMGQQIAAEHELFAGAAIAGATRAVDLSFEPEMDEKTELDMEFGGDDPTESDVIDLGSEDDDGVDFPFDDPGEAEQDDGATDVVEAGLDVTAEMAAPVETTLEAPTIEQQFEGLDHTSELPSLDESLGDAISDSGQDSDATAEINLEELDLDITGTNEELEDTGINEALEDLVELTGTNEEVDPDVADLDDVFNVDDFESTGMRLAPDETGRMPLLDVEKEIEGVVDTSLFDATGHTQILSDDMAVENAVDADHDLADDEATLLASGTVDDNDDDFDYAKTEALPADVFAGSANLDETEETGAVAGTDVDLDLDDLTAALEVSEAGDTVEQPRDDATVEQPRPAVDDASEHASTMAIAPEDMSDELQEARTMTEVGTKLDLARAYVDMGDPAGARSILEEVLDEGDESQRQQAQQLLDSLPS